MDSLKSSMSVDVNSKKGDGDSDSHIMAHTALQVSKKDLFNQMRPLSRSRSCRSHSRDEQTMEWTLQVNLWPHFHFQMNIKHISEHQSFVS